MVLRIFLFLILNFGALAIGSLLMGKGASSGWYQDLSKASWTPPGWVFGFAWCSIMLFLSVYMAKAYTISADKRLLLIVYGFQLLLNILWNPLFFRWHMVGWALMELVVLTATVMFLFNLFKTDLKLSIFILPYVFWLLLAISLNAYIYLKN